MFASIDIPSRAGLLNRDRPPSATRGRELERRRSLRTLLHPGRSNICEPTGSKACPMSFPRARHRRTCTARRGPLHSVNLTGVNHIHRASAMFPGSHLEVLFWLGLSAQIFHLRPCPCQLTCPCPQAQAAPACPPLRSHIHSLVSLHWTHYWPLGIPLKSCIVTS